MLIVSVLHLPSYENYRAVGSSIPDIADHISIKHLNLLRRCLQLKHIEFFGKDTKNG